MKNSRVGRPVHCRRVGDTPKVTCFLPEGIPRSQLERVVLSFDEVEALRLADKLGMYQAEAAEKMNVSRQTFGRIIESAHRKVAEALVEGKSICIEGGSVEQVCRDAGTQKSAGCVCLSCGYEEPHRAGVPCCSELCPECSKPLTRKGA